MMFYLPSRVYFHWNMFPTIITCVHEASGGAGSRCFASGVVIIITTFGYIYTAIRIVWNLKGISRNNYKQKFYFEHHFQYEVGHIGLVIYRSVWKWFFTNFFKISLYYSINISSIALDKCFWLLCHDLDNY